MTQIFGHEEQLENLKNLFLNKEISNSVIFSGPKSIGKNLCAQNLAKFILAGGKEVSDENPIAQQIAERSHPDYLYITRAKDAKTGKQKANIAVDDARKLAEFIRMSPAAGEHKVAIIDAADDLNINSANAILKILEEPNVNSYIILIAHNEASLLPTIKSRCTKFAFNPLGRKDFAAAIAGKYMGMSDEKVAKIYEFSHGSIGEAMKLIDGDGLSYYENMLKSLENYPNKNYEILAAEIFKNDNFEIFKNCFSLFLSRVAKICTGVNLECEFFDGEIEILSKLKLQIELQNILGLIENSNHLFGAEGKLYLDKKSIKVSLLEKI